MEKQQNSTALALVILLAMFFQVVFVMADSRNTPHDAAVEFAQAYYKLDPNMSEHLCDELLTGDNGNVVERYLTGKRNEASQRGFGMSFVKRKLSHVITNTVEKDETSATVVLEGKGKYPLASLFTGEKFKVREELKLVKEGDKWKVCGNPFELASAQ